MPFGADGEPTVKTKQMVCPSCHSEVECHWGPDPFAAEIYNDMRPHWMCDACRRQRAEDV
jgi:C4-type Zn-finger protein